MIDRWRHIRNSWGRLETRLSVAVLAALSPSSLVPRVKERTPGTRLKSFSFQFRGDSLTLDLPLVPRAFPLSLDIPMQIDIIKEEYARSGRFSLVPNSLWHKGTPAKERVKVRNTWFKGNCDEHSQTFNKSNNQTNLQWVCRTANGATIHDVEQPLR